MSQLTPSLVRVVLHGAGLDRFADPVEADAYVKVVFLHPAGDYRRPIDPAQIRAEMPQDFRPRLRTCTSSGIAEPPASVACARSTGPASS